MAALTDAPTLLPRTAPRAGVGGPTRSLGVGLLVLAAGLALNTLIGPALLDRVDYPISETLRNETIGLELVSLVLVAPWSVVAGVLVLRGRASAGAALAMAPAAYVAYMFVQYLAGIPALEYGPHHLLQLGLFVLAGWLLAQAWRATSRAAPGGEVSQRRWAVVVAVMAGFIVLRWLPGLVGAIGGAELPEGYAGDPGMHWTIFLLDLGVVVPVSIAVIWGLVHHRAWSVTGLHALVGWFALVPPSVLAMAITKHVNDDPMASGADTALFAVATALYLIVTVAMYRPLLRRAREDA